MNAYETSRYLDEYLLFHYGTREQFMPWPFEPDEALNFPVRCAELCLKHIGKKGGKALDLGCAVGRATFELTRGFESVVGVDYSHAFVNAANRLRHEKSHPCNRLEEGERTTPLAVKLPENIKAERANFVQGDACHLPEDWHGFDCLLLANLLCRLPSPATCLRRLPSLVVSGGLVVITTPFSWLSEYTEKNQWIGGREGEGKEGSSLLQTAMERDFKLVETLEMPFLIREHSRKYQWNVARAFVFERLK